MFPGICVWREHDLMMKRLNKGRAAALVDGYGVERSYAESLDERDPLRRFRGEFIIPKKAVVVEAMLSSQHGDHAGDAGDAAEVEVVDAGDKEEECVYLCGNSLGLQPRALAGEVQRELDVWASIGVEGHWYVVTLGQQRGGRAPAAPSTFRCSVADRPQAKGEAVA